MCKNQHQVREQLIGLMHNIEAFNKEDLVVSRLARGTKEGSQRVEALRKGMPTRQKEASTQCKGLVGMTKRAMVPLSLGCNGNTP